MSTQDLTTLAHQVVADLLGVMRNGFDTDATAQHEAAAIVLASLVEAQQLVSGSEARALAREWQEVIATLTIDVAEMAEITTHLEIKPEMMCHPFYAGKIALLRTLKEMADDDVARFAGSTYPVKTELLRAQLAAAKAYIVIWAVFAAGAATFIGEGGYPALLQRALDHWWNLHRLTTTLEQKLKVKP